MNRNIARFVLITGGFLPPAATAARGQGAVGLAPNIGVAPDGVTLSTAPVVSADRRYVRMGVNANSFGFLGFEVVTQTVGAVGGGFGGNGFGSVPANFALSEGSPFNPNNLTRANNAVGMTGGSAVPISKPFARAATTTPPRKAAAHARPRSKRGRR